MAVGTWSWAHCIVVAGGGGGGAAEAGEGVKGGCMRSCVQWTGGASTCRCGVGAFICSAPWRWSWGSLGRPRGGKGKRVLHQVHVWEQRHGNMVVVRITGILHHVISCSIVAVCGTGGPEEAGAGVEGEYGPACICCGAQDVPCGGYTRVASRWSWMSRGRGRGVGERVSDGVSMCSNNSTALVQTGCNVCIGSAWRCRRVWCVRKAVRRVRRRASWSVELGHCVEEHGRAEARPTWGGMLRCVSSPDIPGAPGGPARHGRAWCIPGISA